jgi:hypothetical protein
MSKPTKTQENLETIATEAKVTFPIWAFLNQSIFSPNLLLNPAQFHYIYNIQLLERCLQKPAPRQPRRPRVF